MGVFRTRSVLHSFFSTEVGIGRRSRTSKEIKSSKLMLHWPDLLTLSFRGPVFAVTLASSLISGYRVLWPLLVVFFSCIGGLSLFLVCALLFVVTVPTTDKGNWFVKF